MDTFRIREEEAGARLANVYNTSGPEIQVRLFREIAKESDWCILGFMDAIKD